MIFALLSILFTPIRQQTRTAEKAAADGDCQ
jgi:hypothetical protein